ncbi:MAG: hypothetical protein INQ03_10505 [Candidatus Heimdallarchaeota archaeon]|nr:hypothetical protein [Candidatus Heimdallarchaeota archaeon]
MKTEVLLISLFLLVGNTHVTIAETGAWEDDFLQIDVLQDGFNDTLRYTEIDRNLTIQGFGHQFLSYKAWFGFYRIMDIINEGLIENSEEYDLIIQYNYLADKGILLINTEENEDRIQQLQGEIELFTGGGREYWIMDVSMECTDSMPPSC